MGKLHFLLAIALISVPAIAQRRGGGGAAAPEGLTFRFMGPAVGNRISAAAGIPGDPTTYYVGAASGGVWKSTNSGQSWAADLRQPDLAGHRRAGGCADRPQDGVGRHRRSVGHSR